MTDTLFALRNITMQYGARTVLRIDELDICQGEILALVGPSGAVKSTLLLLLNFLETPTSGSIRFAGQEITDARAVPLDVRRRVTTVFQRPTLLRRSVQSNVAYGLRLRGRRDTAAEIDATLERVGLTHLAQQPARTLSGGEAQRVALARAMVIQPDALLLDEPTANLDPFNIGTIEKIVRGLNEERGTTIVLVTHNIFQARRLAHRVAFMLEGAIVELADKERFFDAPLDARTAAFVAGDMVY